MLPAWLNCQAPRTRREFLRPGKISFCLDGPRPATLSRMKTTAYFDAIRTRPDRSLIKEEWIERAIASPLLEVSQTDGRLRRWVQVPEMNNRYLRVVLLPDGETVHNAFFDRRFMP